MASHLDPLVSVLVPVFNGADSVHGAVRSILGQTYQHLEVIALNDGSDDASEDLLRQLSREDSRVRVISHDRNRGLAAAMNTLVSQVKGEFFAIQEQDDLSLPDRLALQTSALLSHPEAEAVGGVAVWVDDNRQVLGRFPGILARGGRYPTDRRKMYEWTYVHQIKVANATLMARTRHLQINPRPFDERFRMSIDWKYILWMLRFYPVLGLAADLVLVNRSDHRRSLTANKRLQFAEARKLIETEFQERRSDANWTVTKALHRKARCTQALLEYRVLGPTQGIRSLLEGMKNSPMDRRVLKELALLPTHVGRSLLRSARSLTSTGSSSGPRT